MEPFDNTAELHNKIGTPLETFHHLLIIDITERDYPDEIYDNIVPNPEPKEATMKVGLVDEIAPSYWTTTLFSFPACDTKLNDEKLKISLAEALGILPALSGRVVNKEGNPYNFEDPKVDLQIDLVCRDRGAWFASVESDADFGVLHKDLFSFEVHEPNYIFSRAQRAVVEMNSPPLLAVKVTHYKCGSALMCVMTSHVVSDGRSTYLFMKLWGQLYRELEADFVRDTRLVYKGEVNLSAEAQSMFDVWTQHSPSISYTSLPFKTVRFSITKHDMLTLKESCNAKLDQGFISTDDLFCAIAYRAIIRARGFSPETLASFLRILDIRENFGLKKDSAFGCGILLYSHPSISCANLVSMPIHELALTFRTTLKKHSTKYAIDFLTAASYLPLASNATYLINFIDGPNVSSSSYSKFDPSLICFNTKADTYIRIPHLPGQFHAYAPTPTHHYGLAGLETEHISAILSDTELSQWGFQIEIAPFKLDLAQLNLI